MVCTLYVIFTLCEGDITEPADCVAIKGGGPMMNIQGCMAEFCAMANVTYETG